MRTILLAGALALSLLLPSPAGGQGGRFLGADEVAAEVRRYLATRLDLGAGEAEVRAVHLPAQKVLLPKGPVELAVAAPPNTRFIGRTPLMVVVRDGGGAEIRRLWVTAEVAVYAEVPVPRRPLRAHQPLTASLFEMRRRDLAGLPTDAVTRAEDLEGARALRPLAPGEAVRKSDVELPQLVKQGHLVRLIARRGALTITAIGKALDAGRKGDAVRAINIDSNKMIQGRVVDRAAVEVLF